MYRVTTLRNMALASGMGLALALAWLFSTSGSAALPATPSAERHVCLSGCPYSSIQAAVDVSDAGDVIKVAAGTYTGVMARPRNDIMATGVVTQMVYVSKTIIIQGGYTTTNWTTSNPIVNPTTLDAQGKGRVLYITGNISPTVEDLRLTGGNATGLGGGYYSFEDTGGGMYVITATAVISNNWICRNFAIWDGGGLALYNSSATLSGNMVISNTISYGDGSGLYLYDSPATLSGNLVAANTYYQNAGGSGLYLFGSPATLKGNTVVSNAGIGLYLDSSAAKLSNNMVASNTLHGVVLSSSAATLNSNTVISNAGGGLSLNNSPATLSGNKVVANMGNGLSLNGGSSSIYGNVIRSNIGNGLSLHFDSSALVNNVVADNLGGGIRSVGSSTSLLHTTIARNMGVGIYVTGHFEIICHGTCIYYYYPSDVKLYNTILVGHQTGVSVTTSYPIGITDTALLAGTLWGGGMWTNDADWGGNGVIITGTVNVFGDPDFVNPDAGDYHIGANSAARDAGVAVGVLTDIDDDVRPDGCLSDIGADEFIGGTACNNRAYLPLIRRSSP